MKPHKHAELIKQWADGAIVQYLDGDRWKDVNGNDPIWSREIEQYRIKPGPPKYPQTKMTDQELMYFVPRAMDEYLKYLEIVANAAIARCIQDGDVVPAAIHDRAIRALKRSGFVDNGAEEWKPPVTNLAEGMVPEAMLDKLYDSAMEAAVARMLAKSLEGDIGRGTSYGWRGLLHELFTIDKDAIIEAVKQGK
jgi:hypothetical protein